MDRPVGLIPGELFYWKGYGNMSMGRMWFRCMLAAATLITGSAMADVNTLEPAPVKLTVSERFTNPIGFYDAQPTFSWQLPEGTKAQTAYQLVADDLWDSGKVVSGQSAYVSFAGPPLGSRRQVSWKVRYWDEKDRVSAWSVPAHIELGLLHNSDWKARWIRMEEPAPAPAVVKVDKQPEVTITRAIYGVPGKKEQQIDLTAKLQQQVAAGRFVVVANNATAGRDPAFGTVKTLELEYAINGKTVKKQIPENSRYDVARGKAAKGGSAKAKYVPE